MAKGKGTIKIRMISSAGTGYFIVTTKNPKNVTEKLAFKRYDPKVRKHVLFNESKLK
jgi:large subunit ribosomal protein L33